MRMKILLFLSMHFHLNISRGFLFLAVFANLDVFEGHYLDLRESSRRESIAMLLESEDHRCQDINVRPSKVNGPIQHR